jgi:hypothetical protein
MAPTSCGGGEISEPTLFVDAFQDFDASRISAFQDFDAIPEKDWKLYLHFPAFAEIRLDRAVLTYVCSNYTSQDQGR